MVALGRASIRVPRNRVLVPIQPVKGIVWGSDNEHPVLGDIVVKPTRGGYEVVGACETCKTSVRVNLSFGDSKDILLSPKEALSRALQMHPSPPEKFAANLAEVRRIYGERIAREG